MNKEWQEATNEYLKVRTLLPLLALAFGVGLCGESRGLQRLRHKLVNRKRNPTPFMVLAAKATQGRDTCRVGRRRNNRESKPSRITASSLYIHLYWPIGANAAFARFFCACSFTSLRQPKMLECVTLIYLLSCPRPCSEKM